MYPSTMRLTTTALALLLPLALAACGPEELPPPRVEGNLVIETWPMPTLPGAAQHDLVLAADGRILLSWIQSEAGRRPSFRFNAITPGGPWEGGRTIAMGNRMFVNWADTPHITGGNDGALWAHWLQKSDAKPYAYDVMLVRSTDNGLNWSDPVKVHGDDTTTEHGFVSMWPQGENGLGIAWLDGRKTAALEADAGDAHAEHADHAGGPMSLRANTFDTDLNAGEEVELDGMTCDCCQTDATRTRDGLLLVYRGRTEAEIRDIFATRFDGKAWSKPVRVHADDWTMPACPVNGPSVAAVQDRAVIAWYTAPRGTPMVRIAASTDGGRAFGAPVTLDEGAEVLGRVAVALEPKHAWVAWLREDKGVQSLWLSRRSPDLARELDRVKVATLAGKGRATGLPRMIHRDGVIFLVWTDVTNGQPNLNGVTVVVR